MKFYYTYSQFESDAKALALRLKDEKIDAILGVARGGLFLATRLSYLLGVRELFSAGVMQYSGKEQGKTIITNLPEIKGAKKVLVCDDICDSGACLSALMGKLKGSFECEFVSATLFYKSTAIIEPDFWAREAKQWIVFPWEMEGIGEEF